MCSPKVTAMPYAKRMGIWFVLLGLVRVAEPLALAGSVDASDVPSRPVAVDSESTTKSGREDEPASARRWRKSASLVALDQGEHVVWQFNHGATLNTPYFHPVAAGDGQLLTSDRPPDHAWHHGLWFNWKFINGVNYWEHGRRAGKPDGRTDWSDVSVENRSDHSAVIAMSLAYHAADDDEIVLRERRRIDISAPDSSGAYCMDWTSTFIADSREVTLDRTPPKEQAWGGYAGLSVRFAKNFTERQATSSEGPAVFGEGHRHRSRASAMDYSGLIDGKVVGLAFLDHPRNPRYPTTWYAIRDPVMSYLNAALLNDEPLGLQPSEQMTLRYRLVIHPNRWDTERLQAAHTRFQQAYNSP
jgi:hypothetical protein